MKKLIMIVIGLLLSFQMLQASEERSVVLKSGYNAVQFDANVTLEYLVEKIGFENLISIQGAGQGSAYKKEYVEQGLDFLNSFTQTEAGKAFWFNVTNAVTFTYTAESFVNNKNIGLGAGWSFVGAMLPLTLEEIKAQLGPDNLLVIQGAGQGSTYKKEYIDNGTPFLNSFTAFEVGKGYWIKLVSQSSLEFIFDLNIKAIANDGNLAEISGQEYTISVYTDSVPSSEISQGTISLYGLVNGEMVVIYINDSYPTDSVFQVKVFDANGELLSQSTVVDYDASAIEFSAMTVIVGNSCITLADLKTKIANDEDVTQVDTGCITDMSELFKDNTDFNQDIGNWDVSKVTNMESMFNHAETFNQDISDWNVSNVTSMKRIFVFAIKFNQPIGKWNVSKVNNMLGMFGYAYSFNQPLEDWDVRNVRNMGGLFLGAVLFNQPIKRWDVSNAVDMNTMFSAAFNFNQDITTWNVSNVVDMNTMFFSSSNFNQDISQWNVSKVKNMNNMFAKATAFNQNISSWDVSNVSNMLGMLDKATAFSSTNYDALLNGWSTQTLQSNVDFSADSTKYSDAGAVSRQHIIDTYGWTITDGGLDGTPQEIAQEKIEAYAENSTNPLPTLQDYIDAGVVGVTAANIDAVNSAVSDASREDVDTIEELNTIVNDVNNPCITLADLKTKIANDEDVTKVNTGCITNMSELFKANGTFNQDIGNWDVSNVIDMHNMFAGSIFNQDINSWDVSNVIDMHNMFSGTTAFNQNISSWDVTNVTNMRYMFSQATEFNQDISSWDVANVTDMSAMFSGTTAFNQDISSWDVSNVTDMGHMFLRATEFNQDIGAWNVSRVIEIQGMFWDAQNFNQDISSWDVSNVENMTTMFYGATVFNQDISSWDISNVTVHINFATGSALRNEHNPFYDAAINPIPVMSLSEPLILPSPLKSLENNGEGNITFIMSEGNNVEVSGDNRFKVTVTMLKVSLKNSDITGVKVEDVRNSNTDVTNKFDVTFLAADNMLIVQQKASESFSGEIQFRVVIPVVVTENSPVTSPNNGFLVNMNSEGDAVADGDISHYTYTLTDSENGNPLDGQIQDILSAHNAERAEVGITADLVWDEDIATAAQAYADVLKASGEFKHDPDNYSGAFSDYTGENLYVTSSSTAPVLTDAVASWAAEKADYTYGVIGDDSTCTAGEACGHYTQIIWEATTKVGCGIAQYTTGNWANGHVVVCKYKIPGNFTGQTPY